MVHDFQKATLYCLRRLLEPVAGFCLRRGLGVQDFLEVGKQVFVERARADIEAAGGDPNTSRISVATGLRRREVARLAKGTEDASYKGALMTRVIGRWLTDPDFLTSAGEPRVLAFEAEDSEFRRLVALISKDVGAATVQFELERIKAVEKATTGLRLLTAGYDPQGDPHEGFELLRMDTEDLILAVEENIYARPTPPNLHATTEYTNIAAGKLDQLREWLLNEGLAFHRRARNYISALDKDVNKAVKGKAGFRVVLGSFSRVSKEKSEEE